MKVFIDTEFIEDGRTIDLLSIGLVRETGERLYLEADWTDHSRADEWVQANVLPHLRGGNVRVDRKTMADRIVEFVGPEPEFWAWYADYDWVVLCQLFGRMIDLPPGWPMYCRDFKQMADQNALAVPQPDGSEGVEHNALADALWLARVTEPYREVMF